MLPSEILYKMMEGKLKYWILALFQAPETSTANIELHQSNLVHRETLWFVTSDNHFKLIISAENKIPKTSYFVILKMVDLIKEVP